MSDIISIAATIVFYALCALYVRWCDTIVGPDDFHRVRDDAAGELPADDGVHVVDADGVGPRIGASV